MIRELTGHKVNGCNDGIRVEVLDGPGPGGASHKYRISFAGSTLNPHDPEGFAPVDISFQCGPLAEAGINGITHENLLAILIDRLEGFQGGKYATVENQIALDHLRAAQNTLKFRTQLRLARGVEGTHTV